MIIHTVRKGESLYSIAAHYGVPLKILLSTNPLPNPNRLSPGQAIIVPEPETVYKVSHGDTLQGIARQFDIPLRTLYRNNPELKGMRALQPGDELIISYKNDNSRRPISVSGYVYPSVSDDTLDNALSYLSSIIPFCYGFKSSGDLVLLNDERIIEEAKNASVSRVLLFSNLNDKGIFDNTLTSILLNDSYLQDYLLDSLLSLMKLKDYRILNLDFEYIYPEEKELYTDFIKKVYDMLSLYGYKLWVSLAPKTSEREDGLLYYAHDYPKISAIADKVILMTYEWGYSYGDTMAISPIKRIKEVLGYTISVMPPEKIILGIPNYGYDYTLPYKAGSSKSRTLSNVAALSLAYDKKAEIQYDYNTESPFFRYSDRNTEHEVRFEDARSIYAKLKLAYDNSIYGVSYWNLMNSFPQNFALLNLMFDIIK